MLRIEIKYYNSNNVNDSVYLLQNQLIDLNGHYLHFLPIPEQDVHMYRTLQKRNKKIIKYARSQDFTKSPTN